MHDVVIVGGGIAGMAAAWRLRDLDVLVLEAGDRVGGRIRSELRGRYWLNLGAHVFAGPGSATERLLRETRVEAVDVPGILTALELDGRVVAGGRVETYPFRLPLSVRDRLALVRAGVRLRAAVVRYDRMIRSADRAEVLAHLGDGTFTGWLGRVPPAVDAVLRPTLQRSSAEPEQLAAGYGIGYFQLVWDRAGGLVRNILGGPSTLPEAIAAELGPRVRLGARVVEVATDAEGVRVVDAEGRSERARFAVVATPAYAAREVIRDLDDGTRAALGAIQYGPYVVAALRTAEAEPAAWDSIYALAAARRSFNMMFNTANALRPADTTRRPGGTLMVYSAATLARRLWDMDDGQITERYVEDLDAVFPGIGALVAEVLVQRWEHGLPYVFPGRHRLQRALERPHESVYLAGDYLGSRYTETAIATGTAAADAIRRRVEQRS